MKTIYKKILPFIFSAEILILSFFSCFITVRAVDFMPHDIIEAVEYGIETNDWEPFYRFLYEVPGPLLYLVSQMGAVTTADFQTWVDNNKKLESLIDTVPAKIEDDEIVFTKEFMTELKALLDEYSKTESTKEENGGFYLLPTTKFDEVPATSFRTTQQFRTFRNIIIEKGALAVRFNVLGFHFVDPFSDPDHPVLLVGDLSSLNNYSSDQESIVKCKYFCGSCWEYHNDYYYKMFNYNDQIYETCDDAVIPTASASGNKSYAFLNGNDASDFTLYSTTGERMRVFVSQTAAQNYSVGNRKIYFSENYYTYEPEDLTVAVDDLQKSVDDLQKVIDELLEKISNDLSEKEIEELLRQILEELRKDPGTGGGEGSGSTGDVIVNVDMTQTNSWLAQIYAKVSQIFEKMNSTVEAASDAALAKIQKSLDEIIAQLKKIKNWAAVDTVIDGVDAVADWLDLIKDVLTDGAGAAVDTLSSALQDSTDLMQQKFPFSIPWDILFFVTVLSAEPETPHFEIPIDIDMEWADMNIHYDFVIDFSQFQWLSDLSRLILSMTYAAGLMKKTLDIVSANKEA